MKIVGKSGYNPHQLEDRYSKGFKNIEIQLLPDFLDENLDINKHFEDIKNSGLNVESIHVPLLPDSDDVNLEYLSKPVFYKAFLNYCKLSQMCAEYFEHDVIIVVHNNVSLAMYEQMPVLFNFIKDAFKLALEKYPNITFSLENLLVVLLRKNDLQFRNCGFFEPVELAKYFNEYFNTNRFGTTLDICHMLSTLKSIENYKDEVYYKNFTFTIEEFFKQNKDTITNIHLNNLKNYGFAKGDHGTTFDRNNSDDLELLKYIISLYKKYEYNCNITIEICEPDVNSNVYSQELKQLVEELF